MIITSKRLLHYQRCQRRTFLDVYGDHNQKDPLNDFLRKLDYDRLAHHQTILADQIYQQPVYYHQDWVAGAEATLALMRQGVEKIYQGILTAPGPDGVTLIGYPDLLVKYPGRSNFGDWFYVPTDIQLGKRPKQDYQILVAFHTHILATLQGTWPESAWLILREKNTYEVDLWTRIPQMQEILNNCILMLTSQQETDIFISREKCSLCRWLSTCHALAKSRSHLSLLPGVTPIRYNRLQYLNITTVESLANTKPEELEFWSEFDHGLAQKVILQAKSILKNQALLTPFASEISLQNLPTAPIEIYFDIEAQPDLNFEYLHGILIVDRETQTDNFYPILAEKIEDEKVNWEKFLDIVWAYPKAPIFHFCNYESETVKRLAKRYNTPKRRWQPVLDRFVDIHERVTRSVALPVEGYSLKHIARWLGFEWRNTKANGGQCVFWYDNWLKTGDRSLLDTIVLYNEDDCRATLHVKNWLVDFLHNSQII